MSSCSWRQAGLLAGAVILVAGLVSQQSHGQTLRTRTTTLAMAIQPPQGVTAVQVATGVQISWQAVSGAVEYLISRGPDSTSPTTPSGRLQARKSPISTRASTRRRATR